MRLPVSFTTEMSELWRTYSPPGSLSDFFEALQMNGARPGLRTNTLKWTPAELAAQLGAAGIELKAVPWASGGFAVPAAAELAHLPEYHAGLYYLQETSAMLPAEIAAVQPGETVLDLCAAPGGKTVRLAQDLRGSGLLWSNDVSSRRIPALLRNLDLCGAKNVVATAVPADELAHHLPPVFDCVLADVPCSGSGMLARDSVAGAGLDRYGPARMGGVQEAILTAAAQLVKVGGRLIYSTCSFSIIENEARIAWFLDHFPAFRLEALPPPPGVFAGLAFRPELAGTLRIWPHLAAGEGHFCACLRKTAPLASASRASSSVRRPRRPAAGDQPISQQQRAALADWCDAHFSDVGRQLFAELSLQGRLLVRNQQVSWQPDLDFLPDSLHYLKTGLLLGSFRQHGQSGRTTVRFEPAQAWLLALPGTAFRHVLSLEPRSPALLQFLRGDTLIPEASGTGTAYPNGATVAVLCGRHPLGHAVAQQHTLRNHYPSAWRLHR